MVITVTDQGLADLVRDLQIGKSCDRLIDLKLQPGLKGGFFPEIMPNEFWVTLTNKQVEALQRLHLKDRFRELYGPKGDD